MLKVVFDCNVFLQAIGKGGNHAFGCLDLVSREQVKLMMSQECLEEILEVLSRPELQTFLPGLTEDSVRNLRIWLQQHAEFVVPVPVVFRHQTDPKDEPYINLAIAAGRSYLVSWDKHILGLGNPDLDQGAKFMQDFPQVSILSPKGFLDRFYRELL